MIGDRQTKIAVLNTALAAVALAAAPAAQIGGDPEAKVRKILEEVSDELREIDRMLLESSRKEAGEGMERNVERIRKLMGETQGSQERVVRGIDRLIEELQNMQSRSRNSQSRSQQGQPQEGDQQQRGGERPRDQQSSTRRESDLPDMVRRQERQPGQESEPQEPQNRQPGENPPEPMRKGENIERGQRREDGSEKADREASDARWGNLPKYMQFLDTRGGVPDLPEKYRRLIDAFQKQSHKRGSGSRDR